MIVGHQPAHEHAGSDNSVMDPSATTEASAALASLAWDPHPTHGPRKPSPVQPSPGPSHPLCLSRSVEGLSPPVPRALAVPQLVPWQPAPAHTVAHQPFHT